MIRIDVATSGQSGFVVAVDTDAGTAVIVGQIHAETAKITAWLWKQAGHYPPRGQHAAAIQANTMPKLRDALTRRHAAKGAWWQ